MKRILRKYGYPPDLEEAATTIVLEQAELIAATGRLPPTDFRRGRIHYPEVKPMPVKTLVQFLPEVDVLIDLDPEILAGHLLQYLKYLMRVDEDRYRHSTTGPLNRNSVLSEASVASYPAGLQQRVLHVLMEAWMWLEREGLIASKPANERDWVFITEREWISNGLMI